MISKFVIIKINILLITRKLQTSKQISFKTGSIKCYYLNVNYIYHTVIILNNPININICMIHE